MSSPLSSLRKPHKQPLLPGSRSLPFRQPEYSEDENKLLEEITSNMATARMKMRDPFIGGLPKLDTTRGKLSNHNTPRMSNTSSLAPSDHDLMSAMMNRISLLEQRVTFQNKEIAEKDKRIKILEEKLQIVQAARHQDESDSKTQALEKKCLLLQQHVHEMETFLSDYGMVWVGEKSDPTSSVYNDEDVSSSSGGTEDLWRPESSLAGDDEPPTIDYDKLMENIKDLNVLAGDGISRIQHTTDGARLKVKDFRHTHFEVKKPLKAFKGVGQTLGGDTKPSRLVATTLNKTTQKSDSPELPISVSVTNKHPAKTLTTEQFLNKLPKSVIKGGKIVDIRNSLNEHLTGGKGDKPAVTVVETDTVHELKKRLELEESMRPATPRNITTLRIKSETGNHTYILKMKFTETIGDLRKFLDLQRSKAESEYLIVSAYPNKTHDDNSMTLEASGLTPNGVLHLRPKKGSTS